MSRLMTCPRGHQWESPEAQKPESAGREPSCPLCAATTESPPARPEGGAVKDTRTEVFVRQGSAAGAEEDGGKTLAPTRDTAGGGAATLSPGRSAAGARASFPLVPGYDILDELGRGGMGVVYQARHLKLNRLVALKMILSGAHADEQDLDRFRAEAEAVAAVQHPNIVQIYDVGEHGGLPYFALEYVEGGTLEGQLDGTPWQGPPATQLVETLARAMHFAHERGIVHRDLKPSNVLIADCGLRIAGSKTTDPAVRESARRQSAIPNPQSAIKITDFGLAKRLDRDDGRTRTGTIMGTPSYMAPEQAGGRKDLGPPADVYALGAIFYELLTGRPPFKAATPLDTVLQVLSQEPVPPSQLNARVPRDLETVCLKCLHKEPQRRYASALELADDLRRFLNHEPVRARPVGRVEKLRRWCRRNPVVASLTAAVALVLVAGVVVSAFFAAKAERRARQAARRLYVADLRLVQHAWEQTQLPRVRELLDGQMPERTGGTDLRHFEWHYWDRLQRAGLPALHGHQWPVYGVAFSPDGKYLASAGSGQIVKIWERATGRVVHSLDGHADTVWSVAYSRDGRLASASSDKTVRLWDPATGRLLRTLTGHRAPVRCVAFSRDGKHLASAGEDRVVNLWEVARAGPPRALPHDAAVFSAAFSPDGKHLASGGQDHTVRVWDVTTGRVTRTLGGGHASAIACVAYRPDGSRLASASWDKSVQIWDLSGDDSKPRLLGTHQEAALGVTFSPDGKHVASTGWEGTVKLWDTAGRRSPLALSHKPAVRGVAFSPDGKTLASAGEDKTVRLWDAGDGKPIRTLSGAVGALTLSRDGNPLGPAAPDVLVKVWDPERGGQVPLTFRGHARSVTALGFGPDGKRVASIGWDQVLHLWDLTRSHSTHSFPGNLEFRGALAVGPDGTVALGGRGGEVLLLDGRGDIRRTLAGHTGTVRGLAFSRDGRLASASEDESLRIWDVATGRALHTLKGHVGVVTAVAFNPDGRRLASAGEDRSVRVWDTAAGAELFDLAGHGSSVNGVAFRPDGQCLASAGSDRTVKLWDLATRRTRHTLKGHNLAVNAVVFSPDGSRLASAGEDCTVKLWDADSGQETLTLLGHTKAVTGLAFRPDGRLLASAGKDATVRLWDGTPAE